MATTTATSSLSTDNAAQMSNSVDIKTYNETYRVYVKPTPEGIIDDKATKLTTAGKDNNTWNKLDDQASGYQKVLEQTVKEYRAGTWAGAALIIEDEEERVAIFNRGLDQKLTQKLKPVLTELTEDSLSLVFDGTPEPFNTFELLNEVSRRRNQSPVDKALSSIRSIVKALNPGIEGTELDEAVSRMFAAIKA